MVCCVPAQVARNKRWYALLWILNTHRCKFNATAFNPGSSSMKRIPQLDSIRGLAVLLVLLHNTDKSRCTGVLAQHGWMGVDLFFVLSGLLITGILLDSKADRGYFRNFYARRCLRIWPLYYCALFF